MKTNKLLKVIVILLILCGALTLTRYVLAQADYGLNDAAQIGLEQGPSDIKAVILNIIRWILGFLGIAAVSMIMYAGWVMMSSQGEPEKVNQAKTILKSAIIGLIIILAAFAIVSFVISTTTSLLEGDNIGGGGCNAIVCGEIGGICCGGSCRIGATSCITSGDFGCDSISCHLSGGICCPQLGCYTEGTECPGILPGGSACGVDLEQTCAIEGDCSGNNDLCASNFCSCYNDAEQCAEAGYGDDIANCCICRNKPMITGVAPQGGFCALNKNVFCGTNNAVCTALNPEDHCDLTTANAAPGNFVTITGRFFGEEPGIVKFNDAEAGLANTVVAACADSWTDKQIVVAVPSNINGQNVTITVENDEALSDTTQDDRGVKIDFVVNNIERPGLCAVNPDHGQFNDLITFTGNRLVTGIQARFGNISQYVPGLSSAFGANSNTQGQAKVPGITTGLSSVYAVNAQGVYSNFMNFIKDGEPEIGPYIVSFSPTTGAPGQYVTIAGGGFGNSRKNGQVYFGAIGENQGDFNFPGVCADSYWRDNNIIVKVPEGIANEQYLITVSTDNGTATTEYLPTSQFVADSGAELLPSVCKIEPTMGQNNEDFTLWGEYFDNFNNQTSVVKFHSGKLHSGDQIISWEEDGEAEKIVTTIHSAAISGPVSVIKNGLEGNGINLQVGLCTQASDPDEACGAQICCPNGSFNEGRCVNTMNDCYADVFSSVYEWDFNSGGLDIPTCDGDLEQGGCQREGTLCGPYLECTEDCKCLPPNVDTCADFNLNQCNDSYFCPNSPGQCSTGAAGDELTGVNCSMEACENVAQCEESKCNYSAAINKCFGAMEGDGAGNCSLNKTVKVAQNVDADPANIKYKDESAYCAQLEDGGGRWFMDIDQSCPTNWTRISNGRCIENATTCDFCADGFACADDKDNDALGLCAIGNLICPEDSNCQTLANGKLECVGQSSAGCECCCEINQDQRDCCAPLTCEGSCGSDTDPNDDAGFGLCSGCAMVGTTQADHDAACNCSGTEGKYCDISVEGGVCRDCAQIRTNAECQNHGSTCCIDNMRNKVCRGGLGTVFDSDTILSNDGFCAYYDCATPPDNLECDTDNASTTGKYMATTTCEKECGQTTPQFGQSCAGKSLATCDINICPNFSCKTESGLPPLPYSQTGDTNTCGLCCCDPSVTPDQCKGLDEDLFCKPDVAPCSSDNDTRGLCCGCEADGDCGGDPATLIGCGFDACCHARPNVATTTPEDDDTQVCRNALVRIEFDQAMESKSFNGNVILAGDYGNTACPQGTAYVAMAEEKTGLAKVAYAVKLAIYNIIEPILPNKIAQAFTPQSATSNYCAVPGKVNAYNSGQNGFVEFLPSQLLDGDRMYYAIVVGDENLNSSKGVLSFYDVGLNAGSGIERSPSAANITFNGKPFTNAYIWSFETMSEQAPNNGVCVLNRVEVDPISYLFTTLIDSVVESDGDANDKSFDTEVDSDKVFRATPLSADGQILNSLPGVYSWIWNWALNGGEGDIVSLETTVTEKWIMVSTKDTVTEGNTTITARATIEQSGEYKQDTSDIYVFICENPWPPIGADGNWYPWRDSDHLDCPECGNNMNYEVYYCRDAGVAGTFDDLPAILSDETVVVGTQAQGKCSGGFHNNEKVCMADTDCNKPAGTITCDSGVCKANNSGTIVTGGSCLYDADCNKNYSATNDVRCVKVLKEAYFFRQIPLGEVSGISATDAADSGHAIVTWTENVKPTSTKIYWGEQTGNYTASANINANSLQSDNPNVACVKNSNVYTCDVTGLKNGTTYYFNLTAITQGAESRFLTTDIPVKPTDTTSANVPTSISIVPKDGGVLISWTKVAGAVDYKIYFTNELDKATANNYPLSGKTGNTSSAIVPNLIAGSTYYFVMTSFDENGNESARSNRIDVAMPAN